MKKVFGYIRLTVKEQNETSYLTNLLEAGVPKSHIYIEKISSANSECPSFRRMIKKLDPGDMVFVVKLDHLGKDCEEVRKHWEVITKDRNCDLAVLDTPVLDTRLGENIKDVVLQTFEAFARIKRNYAHQRQAEGIAVAKVNDVIFGRRSLPIPEDYAAIAGMYSNNIISAREAARRLNVATNTFLKWYRSGNSSEQNSMAK